MNEENKNPETNNTVNANAEAPKAEAPKQEEKKSFFSFLWSGPAKVIYTVALSAAAGFGAGYYVTKKD